MRDAIRVAGMLLALVLSAGAAAASDDDAKIHACTADDGAVIYQTDACPPPGARRARARPAPEPVAPPASEPAPAAAAEPPVPPSPARPSSAATVRPRVVPPAVYRPDPPSPAELAGPADPRLSSPERTWRTFVAAMRGGDREAVLTCLTSTALDRLGPLVRSLPPERLGAIVDAIGAVEPAGDLGPFRSLRAARPDGRSRWIFLERTPRGEWKIFAL